MEQACLLCGRPGTSRKTFVKLFSLSTRANYISPQSAQFNKKTDEMIEEKEKLFTSVTSFTNVGLSDNPQGLILQAENDKENYE